MSIKLYSKLQVGSFLRIKTKVQNKSEDVKHILREHNLEEHSQCMKVGFFVEGSSLIPGLHSAWDFFFSFLSRHAMSPIWLQQSQRDISFLAM